MFLALVHHPVLDRHGKVGTTALTNVDLHDIARSARTFGVARVFVVTPIRLQQRMVDEIVGHWVHGDGARHHPRRAQAMERVQWATSLQDVKAAIADERGCAPLVAVTSAAMQHADLGFEDLRRRLAGEDGGLDRPVLLLFGTGWGLAPEVLADADWKLPAIERAPALQGDEGAWNHLSVRAAAAIALDRLLGRR